MMNITNTDMFYIRMASKMASNLSHVMRSKHAAILVERKKIISIGVNKFKSSPIQEKFAKPVTERRLPYLFNPIHAENDCLKNVSIDNPKHVTLYVVQMRNGNLEESCPCDGCAKAIKHVGIHRVVHSVPNGIVEKIYEY